jgi:hypothetical protein
MGTRCLTIVYDAQKRPLVNLYRQYDGYPSGHGAELAEFLSQFAAITNGIAVGETRRTANGMGCLAAQLVAHFKESVGGFYIHSIEATECGQDYEYHVYQDEADELCVRVKNRGCNLFGLTMSDTDECLFDGPVFRLEEFCAGEL